MASNAYQTPDLASILATLAAYAPPPQPQITHTDPPAASTPALFSDEHLPPASAPQQPPVPSPTPQSHQPPPIDPATLTTWPSALRCITRTIARNEAALSRIRHLIHTQQQHERQWWEGREALVRKQQQRGEGRKALDEVLKAVGGKVDSTRTDPCEVGP
ncbi:Protein of unknown function DUF2458 [Lasallia pustulata]|uniref:Uncharacterized protein n=1 Tax=Lasallia pustulata TaxID=136370 RepID=A0A1W5D575_9LECA|nr:Protein of unknown function DUF2458 [Lasallia pustulata]